jgi:DNA repair exonuclease SbcCD ATPase subunit
MSKFDDISREIRLAGEYARRYELERTTRKKLQDKATDLRTAERERDEIDKKFSEGDLYTSDLKKKIAQVDSIREDRNKLSTQLEMAVRERNECMNRIRGPILNKILEVYNAIIDIDNELQTRVKVLQRLADAVDKPGLSIPIKLRMILATSGLAGVFRQDPLGRKVTTSCIPERDRQYIAELQNELAEGKNDE